MVSRKLEAGVVKFGRRGEKVYIYEYTYICVCVFACKFP